nr:hypothetical protein [Tanacetum cinerariifolium]
LNKLVNKFEEDFKKKDWVRNDENDDTTATTNDKNDLLQFDSKMESDSPESDDDNQKSVDDDGKQDVVMDEIDEQNNVMDNENKDAEAVELSSSIKRCGHPMKHSYNLDVKDNGDQTVEHNDTNEDTGNTDSAFVDIRDKQNNDDSELSKNVDAKYEKENEEFDALAITICNVCHPVPLQIINIEDSKSEKEELEFSGDTDNEEKYDPKKDDDYKGEFYKSPYELKPIEPKIRVSTSEKLVADTLFAMMYKPRKDDDKTMRKYCFKTGFLQANFLDKNVDAIMKVKNFEKKLKEAVNNDTALTKFQQIQFIRVIKKLRRAKLEVVKLDFKKRNDHADSGIIVMTAMDCYMRKVKKMKDMFLEGIPYTQLVNLRQMIATKIMMSKINIRSNRFRKLVDTCKNDTSWLNLLVEIAIRYRSERIDSYYI